MAIAANPLVRRLLHLYWRFARGLTMGVRGVVLDDTGRVCLIRHTYVSGWHLPGGGVEVGETALQALARELEEEAMITFKEEPLLKAIYFNARVSRRDHVLVYLIKNFSMIGKKTPDREIAAVDFFPVDALPEDTAPSTRRRLGEILKGDPPSSIW